MRKILLALFSASVTILASCFCARALSPEARKSFEEFERKAEAGDTEALYRLSAILEKGFDSIPADTLRSLSLLRRSAEKNYPPALNYLGFLYQNGNILPQNVDSALYFIRRAADAGDAAASHNLAYLILHENHVDDRDSVKVAEALRYLVKAAESGFPASETMLADIYAEGRLARPDSLKARELYEKAIASGFRDAELRLLNLFGPRWRLLNSQEALEEGIRYWRLGAPIIATELFQLIGPSEPQTARAYALLGLAYSRGEGVPYDHRKSNEYFSRAAILGNPSAQFILAETLEIFPDALSQIFPVLPDSMTPESLRNSAEKKGVSSAEEATRLLLDPNL